jgi:hypothetical protein
MLLQRMQQLPHFFSEMSDLVMGLRAGSLKTVDAHPIQRRSGPCLQFAAPSLTAGGLPVTAQTS